MGILRGRSGLVLDDGTSLHVSALYLLCHIQEHGSATAEVYWANGCIGTNVGVQRLEHRVCRCHRVYSTTGLWNGVYQVAYQGDGQAPCFHSLSNLFSFRLICRYVETALSTIQGYNNNKHNKRQTEVAFYLRSCVLFFKIVCEANTSIGKSNVPEHPMLVCTNECLLNRELPVETACLGREIRYVGV